MMKLFGLGFLLATVMACVAGLSSSPPETLSVNILKPTNYQLLRQSNASSLYKIVLPNNSSSSYQEPPYLVKLKGTHFQLGYDYAALLASETSYTYQTFLQALTRNNATKGEMVGNLSDFLWSQYYHPYIPNVFLEELEGMRQWSEEKQMKKKNKNGGKFLREDHFDFVPPEVVSRRFYALANMPADLPNIIAAFEDEFENGWPKWLKAIVNEIIDILEHLVHSCDAYGVWGSRTVGGQLFTSRNLDYNRDTGINKYKLIMMIEATTGKGKEKEGENEEQGDKAIPYATMGFTFGIGALAGQNLQGVTTSEMNLDNSKVTFSGLPFPLRLRYILENAGDLPSAMQLWNATNNTNSFNFLIGSAKDTSAFALETIRHFTAVFPADSPVERAATYNCGLPPNVDPSCPKWTSDTGKVKIGFPLPQAVWRTNHGFSPRVMKSQEPLFNNTVFRYNLMHELFLGYQTGVGNHSIGETEAVKIVATLGTKGANYLTCDQPLTGDNVLSVAYVPGKKKFYVAWEDGKDSSWRPAACAPYVEMELSSWFP